MAIISEHHIFLSEDANVGLQTRLKDAITRAIWDGRFSPGDRLPATRALAKHLGISRITVSLAYDSLLATGYIVSVARSGYFVAPDAPTRLEVVGPSKIPADERLDWDARLGPVPPALGAQATPADWRRFKYPFIFGEPDVARFPVDDWRDCVRRALGKRHFEQIADDASDRDDPFLVEQIVRRSVSGRGVAASVEEVLVTAGAQNALWIMVQVLFGGRGGSVAMEDPGYPELRNLLRQQGLTIHPIPVDREGMRVDHIPDGVDAVFVTPSHQAPTGATMSMARRKALLDRAEALDFAVIEDDYDYEMSYTSPALPALKSLDQRGRVIYIGSFSKSIFPGLRLGYLTGDARVVDHARAIRTLSERHPPGLTQRTVAYFLSEGHYNSHSRRMRLRMSHRNDVLREELARHGLSPALKRATGGTTLWLRGPDGLDCDALAIALRDKSVLIEPGSAFYSRDDAPKNRVRLGFATIETTQIADGVALIAETIREQVG
ncbi:PLP-dependent aminotransferase family protein [Hasllibacter sp. MH4015]|uniref:MocR-like pyridoxine biosynthesis transcription factor PdxR n=1 Tax=Hasllibacter sp. MH4015 TaxID=2854029 RepID=UPI001CD79531|nr:PLP-dependent aminotransferase family protein [Hasllibacter sp. MH4015]